MSTDVEWEKWGQQDPYYGVFTNEKFRSDKLDEQSRLEFFESGKWHVQYVLDVCHRYLDPTFAPKSILDFGCGVGRVLPAMASRATEVVGLDVSESMLREAQRNCASRNILNVVLRQSDDGLTAVDRQFDLVHSVIVFQHIEPDRGRLIFARLLELVAPGGVGAIQVTYAKMVYAPTWGLAPPPLPPEPVAEVPPPEPKRRGLLGVLSGATAPAREVPAPVPVEETPLLPEPPRDPEMQMNSYNLNHLLFALQQAGIQRFHTEFTDHGGELGVFLFFQKPAN